MGFPVRQFAPFSPTASASRPRKYFAALGLYTTLLTPIELAAVAPVRNEVAPIRIDPTEHPEKYVAHHAERLGLSGEMVVCIATYESRFRANAIGDRHLTCPITGQKQRSRGIFQISDCFHPEVSDEVAFSIPDSTEWALKRIKQGYGDEWSTFERCKNL
jgi:hypothetical protein